jgi:hypothetical protein
MSRIELHSEVEMDGISIGNRMHLFVGLPAASANMHCPWLFSLQFTKSGLA